MIPFITFSITAGSNCPIMYYENKSATPRLMTTTNKRLTKTQYLNDRLYIVNRTKNRAL